MEKLSDEQKMRMQMWVYATTDAQVISDPEYRAVVQIVQEAGADLQAEVTDLRLSVRRLNTRSSHAQNMVAILRRRAEAAEGSERKLRESLKNLLEKWEAERAEYPAYDPRAQVAGVVVNLCEDELRDVLNGKGPW